MALRPAQAGSAEAVKGHHLAQNHGLAIAART